MHREYVTDDVNTSDTMNVQQKMCQVSNTVYKETEQIVENYNKEDVMEETYFATQLWK